MVTGETGDWLRAWFANHGPRVVYQRLGAMGCVSRVTGQSRVVYHKCWTRHCQAPTSRPRKLRKLSLEMHLVNISAMLCAAKTKVTDMVLLATQSRMKCQRDVGCVLSF
eukprot:6173976-Pleurochrysis_carterae.AAC.3